MELYRLLSSLESFSYEKPKDMEISGISSDSRRIKSGDLFVCIRGLHTDGHAYIEAAARAGAAAVVTEAGCEARVPAHIPQITVPSTRSALARLCHAWYGYPGDRLRLIAVTGTNGKTSVSFMLRAIWEASMSHCGVIGTVRCDSGERRLANSPHDPLANMTTPDPEDLYRMLAEMVSDGVDTVIMEATSHALALGKLDALHFDVAVFTNLTPEHLDFHGDMEQYFLAKSKLFDMCDLAVINGDDPYGARLAGQVSCPVRLCSAKRAAADYLADDIEDHGVHGVTYRIRSRNARTTVRCPIPGTFSVMNSLQAASVALERGKTPGCIHDALAALGGVSGRMERVRLPLEAEYTVFVDYAHTPDALENLLRTARGFCRGENRLILLFGCGGDRDRGKRPLMGELAARLADLVIVTSDNSRSEEPRQIMEEILVGMRACPETPYIAIEDRREAIGYAIAHAGEGDVILLAGKGHESYEIDKTGRHPFDEKAIAAEYARQRAARREHKDEND
ncbi:MAG: UDP-N-acetylmuramoyl-L-alanyl-D-glutamate--2,6-diaminopimelate ligase [Clostridia bacterium]|nr:UDP-N-acetylmuramoyl-L-alanyl-D-glutamate--2,6-diaminopimelate ligase [Clostridia bacterium]